MLLFETKLPFASSWRSTWPRCNTVYCRWGRYDTTDITNINAITAARVSQGSHTLKKTQGNGLSKENQGNLREFTKLLREFLKTAKFSGNGYGRFKCCFWECYVVLHMFCPQFSSKTTGKISHSPNSPRVDICSIYLPMVNCWMACIHPNNGVHFHLRQILML